LATYVFNVNHRIGHLSRYETTVEGFNIRPSAPFGSDHRSTPAGRIRAAGVCMADQRTRDAIVADYQAARHSGNHSG
jgi:hypothetical protein